MSEREQGVTFRAIEHLIDHDLYRVEPIHQDRLAARRDARILGPFAEVPQANLVEVFQADQSGTDRLLAAAVRHDAADVDLEEPEVADDVHVGHVADVDEEEEDERDGEEDGGEDGEALAGPGRVLQVALGDAVRSGAGEVAARGRDLADARRAAVTAVRVPDGVIDRSAHCGDVEERDIKKPPGP